MTLSLKITGVKEIDNCLKGLSKELTHSILGAAHLKAAEPLIKRESYLAPEGPTGNLRDSIGGLKVSSKRASVLGEVIVGPQRRGGKKGFAGHLVEFGTRQRKNKRGANRGVMPKKPFAKPAFEQTKGLIEASIAEQIGKKLVSRMKRELKGGFVK